MISPYQNDYMRERRRNDRVITASRRGFVHQQRRGIDHAPDRGEQHRIVAEPRANAADETNVAAVHVVGRSLAQRVEPRFGIAGEDADENVAAEKVGDDRRLAKGHGDDLAVVNDFGEDVGAMRPACEFDFDVNDAETLPSNRQDVVALDFAPWPPRLE